MDELDERAFLFGVQTGPNHELLGRISWGEVNLLGILSQLELEQSVRLCDGLL